MGGKKCSLNVNLWYETNGSAIIAVKVETVVWIMQWDSSQVFLSITSNWDPWGGGSESEKKKDLLELPKNKS